MTETSRAVGPVSRPENRQIAGPEQRLPDAEQGIAAAHRRVSSCVNERIVYNAIAAIFVAFRNRSGGSVSSA
jgi:hypothetical protein